jgi:hypothetical protein
VDGSSRADGWHNEKGVLQGQVRPRVQRGFWDSGGSSSSISSSSRERGEHRQDGPLDVQVLFLFGSGLAPAPGEGQD